MKEFQIEKVDTTIPFTWHTCILVGYYKNIDTIANYFLSNEKKANEFRDKNSVGLWKIKQK